VEGLLFAGALLVEGVVSGALLAGAVFVGALLVEGVVSGALLAGAVFAGSVLMASRSSAAHPMSRSKRTVSSRCNCALAMEFSYQRHYYYSLRLM